MAGDPRTMGWRTRQLNGLHVRLSRLARPASGFVSHPEPRTIGSFARGKQLVAGNFLFAGYLVEAPETPIWDVPVPSAAFDAALHGFTWLDDLAAVGDSESRKRAQDWTGQWIADYGSHYGPGWLPEVVGRRLIRWINNAIFLLNGQSPERSRAYFRALGRQTRYLSRRWATAAPGLPRFEALTGLIYAGLALEGMEPLVAPAVEALARECAGQIDDQGGIPTRNPEDLLEVFTLLTWAAQALGDADQPVPAEHGAAIARIAPTLRALRHADGGLARFHGGGRGIEGRLDQALASSGVRGGDPQDLAMGFARLSSARSSVIVDAAAPPQGENSYDGHASTLAFELTSGRRPVIVGCGSGRSFGEEWRRAGRATQSHSTLAIDGYSSARLDPVRRIGQGVNELLADVPQEVGYRRDQSDGGRRLSAWHNGYRPIFGLTHLRDLHLSYDGRSLSGEDTLGALSEQDQGRLEAALARRNMEGIGFALHFHLHPDVEAELDMGGQAVSLALKSGELWVFRFAGEAEMSLAPSVYLEKGRLKPRPAQQILVSSRVLSNGSQINWTLAKTQETPQGLRDLAVDDETWAA